MASITTPKKIDLAQLDKELGGKGLSSREVEGQVTGSTATLIVTADGSPVTQAELNAAVAAHAPVVDVATRRKQMSDLRSKSGILTPQELSDAVKFLLEGVQ